MDRGNKMSPKRALEVIQMAAEETSTDSFCGFSDEEERFGQPPAKRLRTFPYENIQSRCSSVISQYSEISEISGKNNNKIDRKPTRRPDPKVNNRNAIMARENRRKHKEHQERLERENALLMKENEELKTKLKTKDRQISSLRNEYKYLKSVIANKTQIVEILRAVQKSRVPLTSSLVNFCSSDPSNTVREMSPAAGSTTSTETATSGYQSPSSASENSDYEMDANVLATDPQWSSEPIFSDIPDANVDVDHFLDDFTNSTTGKTSNTPFVRDEHSYSENIEDPGVCVHISNQKLIIKRIAKRTSCPEENGFCCGHRRLE
uniref:CSON013191 protein n=1 Tax=Culicoides sonorensis TaxID=179676 RepID=A0A336MA63_CULSO